MEKSEQKPKTASQKLRELGVEIDASDHRTPEEILLFLTSLAIFNSTELSGPNL
jgi:hypothetical protein